MVQERGGVGALGPTWKYLSKVARTVGLDPEKYKIYPPQMRLDALEADIGIRIQLLRQDQEAMYADNERLKREKDFLGDILADFIDSESGGSGVYAS